MFQPFIGGEQYLASRKSTAERAVRPGQVMYRADWRPRPGTWSKEDEEEDEEEEEEDENEDD